MRIDKEKYEEEVIGWMNSILDSITPEEIFMTNQDAKRIGNQHSTLLSQLIKAAEDVKPKEVTPFKDTIIKIASDTPPTLAETLSKLAADAAKHDKFFKKAQFSSPAAMPKPLSGPDFGGSEEGGDIGAAIADDLGGGGEPDFDAMATGQPEEGLPGEGGDLGGDLEGAKQHLADALVALCGSPEEAMQLLSGPDELGNELGNELGDEELGDEELGGELGDDMVPSELLGAEEPNDMMKSMPEQSMQAPAQGPSLMGQNPVRQTQTPLL